MKKYTIELEVDDNITTKDIQHAIEEMSDNLLNTRECFYEIKKEKQEEAKQKRYIVDWDEFGKKFYLRDTTKDWSSLVSLPKDVQTKAISELNNKGMDAAKRYLEHIANDKCPDWIRELDEDEYEYH